MAAVAKTSNPILKKVISGKGYRKRRKFNSESDPAKSAVAGKSHARKFFLRKREPRRILLGVRKMRLSIGLGALSAFFVALTLASSPQLHERLHGARAQHECAATLITSGNYHYAGPPPVLPTIPPAPIACVCLAADSEFSSIAVPAFILEHAPPALL